MRPDIKDFEWRVFYTRYKANQVEWVRRVGIRARETNQIIERKHGTLKDRLKPMRGLKKDESADKILKGYVVNYNFVRPHLSLKGKTPAQEAGIGEGLDSWLSLITLMQQHETIQEKQPIQIEVRAK